MISLTETDIYSLNCSMQSTFNHWSQCDVESHQPPHDSAPRKKGMCYSFCFVFFSQHFRHLEFVSNNVLIIYWSWNLWKFLMKLINSKAPVSANFLIKILGQVSIHDSRTSWSFFSLWTFFLASLKSLHHLRTFPLFNTLSP